MPDVIILIISLLFILLSAEIFTNGVETLGRRLSLSQAVVGSILAAVGTALPETILPCVAIFMTGGESAGSIGVGAILGAPFMLGTLAFFLVGLTVLVTFLKKKRGFELAVEPQTMKRDLTFFLILYGTAIGLPLFISRGRGLLAIALMAGYAFYAYRTFSCESADILHTDELYFRRALSALKGLFGLKNSHGNAKERISFIVLQVLTALGLMVGGAHSFVGSLQTLSSAWGMDPLLFALLIAPVATELPEKFNSVSWTLKGRDTLALGNITGAMVFQATFPVSVGLLFTKWEIGGLALLSAVLALASALMILGELHFRNKLSPVTVLLAGGFYLIYTATILLCR